MSFNNCKRVKSIWLFSKKYIPMFLLAETCILVSYTISVLLPLNLTKLIDEVLYGNKYFLLPEIIRNYIFMFLISATFNFIYAFVWQYLNNHYVLDVKNKVFEKIIFAKANFLTGMNSGDIMTRIDRDSEQFIYVIQRNLFHFINSIVMCVAIVIFVARLSVIISIMLVVAAVLPILITRLCVRFTEKYSKKSQKVYGNLTGKLYETIKGFREIKLFLAEKMASQKIFSPLKDLITLGNKIRAVDFGVNKLIYFVNLSISILIYSYSVYLFADDKLTIGIFLAIIEYIALLHKKINWTLRIYLDWFNRKVGVDRVNEILELETESNKGERITGINTIEFRNVDFAYNSENIVLNNLNFKIKKGEKVGIVGSSGNGKTTIVSLLLGLYETNNGHILINNIPISKIEIASLREKIGVVSQDIVIFQDTVRYNLNLDKEFSDEEIWKVLDVMKLTRVIKGLPDGIDTVISSSSCNLSGGEKQRLMIARLLLRKPEFIILDEATSALDMETEKCITEYITEFSSEATMIIVSHRLEAIKECDRILVLDDHMIVDEGTHIQLLKKSQTYLKLFGRV